MLKRPALAVSAATMLTVAFSAASAAGTESVSASAPPVTVWVYNMYSDR